MFAIETELGRFEGETEQEAKKLLNKAKRDKAKALAVEMANRETAKMRAKATAFDILNRVITGEPCPSGWRFYPHGNKFAAKCRKERSTHFTISHLQAETPHGFVSIADWYVDYLGSVMNGSGHDVLVFVRDGDNVQCYCVGLCDGVYAMVFVEGLSIEYFSTKDMNDAN